MQEKQINYLENLDENKKKKKEKAYLDYVMQHTCCNRCAWYVYIAG